MMLAAEGQLPPLSKAGLLLNTCKLQEGRELVLEVLFGGFPQASEWPL